MNSGGGVDDLDFDSSPWREVQRRDRFGWIEKVLFLGWHGCCRVQVLITTHRTRLTMVLGERESERAGASTTFVSKYLMTIPT